MGRLPAGGRAGILDSWRYDGRAKQHLRMEHKMALDWLDCLSFRVAHSSAQSTSLLGRDSISSRQHRQVRSSRGAAIAFSSTRVVVVSQGLDALGFSSLLLGVAQVVAETDLQLERGPVAEQQPPPAETSFLVSMLLIPSTDLQLERGPVAEQQPSPAETSFLVSMLLIPSTDFPMERCSPC